MTTLEAAPRHVARWSAIGCTVHVETRLERELDLASALVRQVLVDVDEVASRFRDDSDLSRVNRNPGQWVEVDPLLVAALHVAVTAAEETEGLVHPLLGRSLIELGYDRTFSRIQHGRPLARSSTAPPIDAWRSIGLTERAVCIPAETSLDLGATCKAWCTDLAVAALEAHLDGAAIVSIGGDLRTVGEESWEVAVTERPDGAIDTMVEVTGALATSSTQARRWASDGGERHHLLDPRTGLPAEEVWRTVTIAAPTCVAANTATTAAVVLGREAPAWLDIRKVAAARLVARDGDVLHLGGWPDDAEARTLTDQGERP